MKPKRRQQKPNHAEAPKQGGSEPRPRDRIVEPLVKRLNFDDRLLGIDLRYLLPYLSGQGATPFQALERFSGFWRIGGRRRPGRRPSGNRDGVTCGTGSSGIGRAGDEPVGQALGGFQEAPGISTGMAADLPLKEN